MPRTIRQERPSNMQHSVHRDPRTVALEVIKNKSFRLGSIRLSSGKISEYYLDMKPSMFDPEGSYAIATLLLDKLSQYDIDLVGGLEMGAVPLVSNVTMLSGIVGRPLPGFFVRKAPKDHGTQKLIEAVGEVAGKKVAIIDDVTTTGESAMKSVRAVQAAGGTVAVVISVVDRLEGAREFYAAHRIPFDSVFTKDDVMRA